MIIALLNAVIVECCLGLVLNFFRHSSHQFSSLIFLEAKQLSTCHFGMCFVCFPLRFVVASASPVLLACSQAKSSWCRTCMRE